MPNLIIEAVPPQQTGEATGFNALVRSVGSSLGSQITAAILAASAGRRRRPTPASPEPSPISAGVAACAGVVAIFIPRVATHVHAPAMQEIGAASPLGRARALTRGVLSYSGSSPSR